MKKRAEMWELLAKINERGYTQGEFAEKIGMSPQSFVNKISGKYEFKVAEIRDIKKELDLDDEEVRRIFVI